MLHATHFSHAMQNQYQFLLSSFEVFFHIFRLSTAICYVSACVYMYVDRTSLEELELLFFFFLPLFDRFVFMLFSGNSQLSWLFQDPQIPKISRYNNDKQFNRFQEFLLSNFSLNPSSLLHHSTLSNSHIFYPLNSIPFTFPQHCPCWMEKTD
ncbi:hypothetical protein WUBG_01899 [Wuchereria bancrofti]|uniref:Uncharacterized protein n=1 Tax=Wuchereria bancrofti TaxID=6293 RepID=J9EX60_WUCBA|nr:hypothetical protein WUBG_01899 [Wuchereria bancrofti]